MSLDFEVLVKQDITVFENYSKSLILYVRSKMEEFVGLILNSLE